MTDEPKPRKAPPPRPTPTSTGGRTALTPAISATICEAVGNLVPLKFAAMAAGITERSLHEWMERGQEGEEPFAQFAQDVAHARARGVVQGVIAWKDGTLQSGMPDWKAIRELLATVAPDEFAPTASIEIKVRGEAVAHVLRVLREGLDPSAYGAVVECLHRAGSSEGEAGEPARRDH